MHPQADLLFTENKNEEMTLRENLKKQKPQITYLGQFGILIGLIGVFAVVGSIVAVAVWFMMTKGSMLNMEKDMLNPLNTNAARWVQLIAAFFMFFVPAIIFAAIVNRQPIKHLGFNSTISLQQIVVVLFLAFAALGLSGALGTLNELIPISAKLAAKFKKAEEAYNHQVMIMAKMNNWKDYIFALVVIAFAPAVFEEVLFRGALQKLLQNWMNNYWVAIIVTSILFSAVHLSYYGFLPRVGLGIILGLLYYYGKNIWLCIFAHFLNNGIAVTALYVYTKSGKNGEDVLKETFPLWYGVIALGLVIVFLHFFKQISEKNGAHDITDGIPKLQTDNNPFA